jgi:hypothetical protein
MKFTTQFLILRNYKLFLPIFLFFSFYFKFAIFDFNFYNFYNDSYFYCCNEFSWKKNFSENLYNFIIFNNKSYLITHLFFLAINLYIPVLLLNRFESFFEIKLSDNKSIFFILVFVLLPLMIPSDIKYQIGLTGFFLYF